ncbi:aminotransferase class III-fold pyridoxal phosphate-dependent enzyme [Amylibacter sp.]|nr:aminotransferase class III-fold pyridoxal phosphate-dependent enzyme [Amylibacter sp.]
MSKVVCIVQARSGSSRLPRKIFTRIGDFNLLQWIDFRLSSCILIDEVIFALPVSDKEENIQEQLSFSAVNYVNVPEKDVLSRYYSVASLAKADVIVRITADCPFIDPIIVDQVIKQFFKNGNQYLSNTNPPSFPDGLDVEVFTYNVLREAFNNTTLVSDREHVTPFIIRNYASDNVEAEWDLSSLRITIDDKDDLARCTTIFDRLKSYDFSLLDLKNLWDSFPEIFYSQSIRNEGSTMTDGYKLWSRAKQSILGGNMLLSKRPEMFAPNIWPPYFKRADGIDVTDLDNKVYSDFSLMGVGTNLLGYARAEIVDAVTECVRRSNMSTLNCPEEVLLSEKLINLHPWSGMAKFARTGGEANAIAVRIARAAARRDKIAICGYHGWHDWYLSVNLREDQLSDHLLQGLSTRGLPSKYAGLTEAFKYGDINRCEQLLENREFACVIMEVSRFSEPNVEFVQAVREICTRTGTLLIFDECTSGFRQYLGGLHMKIGIYPDLCMFGKAIANGHPMTAVIGRKEVMKKAEESFISSTFWTDRVGPVAALATLEIFEKEKTWEDVSLKGAFLKKNWQQISKDVNLEIEISGLDPLAAFKFKQNESNKLKTIFTQKMLAKGYLATNSVYLSSAHDQASIDEYLKTFQSVFKEIAEIIESGNIDESLIGPEAHTGFARLN